MQSSRTMARFFAVAANSSSQWNPGTSGLICALAFAVSVYAPSAWGQTSATFTRLYAFSGLSIDMNGNLDGASPEGTLVQGRDGNFYGTASVGGQVSSASGEGTVFKVTPGGALTTLYNFSGGTDGATPSASLLEGDDGNLYGTTSGAGGPTFNDPGAGTIFQITPGGQFTTLYRFSTLDGNQANQDGGNPTCNLIQDETGNFFGTTQQGGSGAAGTVFRLSSAGVLTTLHTFSATDGNHVNADGARPIAGLIKGSGGNFYGTTFYGGSGGYGTVFRMTPAGALTTLHSFSLDDGEHPFAGLIQGSDGNFYGTTLGGGANRKGTIFQITPAGVLTSLHSFTGGDGANPYAGLVQGSDTNLYGTTYLGGANNLGTVFQITPAGTLRIVHGFGTGATSTDVNESGDDGSYPLAGLVQGGDGNFYGSTSSGPSDSGTIFRVAPVEVLAVTSPASATVLIGHAFTYQITATGAATTLAASDLPAGLSFDATNSVISGTLTTLGTFPISLRATHANATVTSILALNVVNLPVVSLTASPTVKVDGGGVSLVTIILSAAQTNDVVVNLMLEGTAISCTDYQTVKTRKKIKAGNTIKEFAIRPLGDLGGASHKTVKLLVEPGTGYTVGADAAAKVKILR